MADYSKVQVVLDFIFGTRAVDDRLRLPFNVFPVVVLSMKLMVPELGFGIAGFSLASHVLVAVWWAFGFRLDLCICSVAPGKGDFGQNGKKTLERNEPDQNKQQGKDAQGDIELAADGQFVTSQGLELAPDDDKIFSEKI